ncbi:MAG: D-alanine--D-alanine ligase [Tabrizicola sp.]|uniref:D-alanine--D-alanine ligase n=1 Tax=Tabrizicola sp. TaxID=2005166 RepID=UPI002732B7D7|nr:D-alanine--D-alanine ligase [Tabrizicola sp.]MDP3263854.1 D-alanine--D-alanine ligase [Tabrizicola sp.]MDP3647218.1 D-alanine--D-alanine ligase [Paracoccaceae bacterium]MDZ4088451.1 D-alanine--D-alanine ligase [Tabrizicola sp.]
MAGASSGMPSRVAVLMGGPSAERDVSLVSGHECAKALREAGYEVVEVDCDRDLPARLSAIRPDVCFNALHGRWGEDGCVQGMLEWLGLPYTHSGVLASALAMDKAKSKEVYAVAGLPTVTGVLATRDAVEAGHVLPPPYVVKPNNEGSSVGVYIVHPGSNAPRLAATMPDTVMVETYAPGRELTTTVMGDRALGVTDIITDGWYDYDAKYKPGGSRHDCPANIPAEIEAACLDYALRAHRALGCRGVSRTDFRWDEALWKERRGLDGLILLETNTQPGMTPTSLAPEQAAMRGIGFPEFCAWMVRDASCNR